MSPQEVLDTAIYVATALGLRELLPKGFAMFMRGKQKKLEDAQTQVDRLAFEIERHGTTRALLAAEEARNRDLSERNDRLADEVTRLQIESTKAAEEHEMELAKAMRYVLEEAEKFWSRD